MEGGSVNLLICFRILYLVQRFAFIHEIKRDAAALSNALGSPKRLANPAIDMCFTQWSLP